MGIEEYERLIAHFVDGTLPAEDFEHRYLTAFKMEPEGMHPIVFEILNELFGSVDAYWAECLPEQETPFLITEMRLRDDASAALAKLRDFLEQHGPSPSQ